MPKITGIFQVAERLVRLRIRGEIDCIIYPIGGPHFGAIARDFLLLPWIRRCCRRVILQFHAAGISEKLEATEPWIRRLVAWGYRRWVDEALVLTDFGRRDAEVLGIGEVTVLPNAVPDLEVSPPPRRLVTDAPRLLSVGHLCRDKGTPELLEAFARLVARGNDVRLVLVGEPIAPYTRQRLISDIKATGCSELVEWRGMLDGAELADAYQQADLFVFSSMAPYESFGLVLAEAMQWSLPLVVTDWRANLSVVTRSFGGVVAERPCGRLVDALEEALWRALEQREKWPDWGRTNHGIYRKFYQFDHYRQRILQLVKRKSGDSGNVGEQRDRGAVNDS